MSTRRLASLFGTTGILLALGLTLTLALPSRSRATPLSGVGAVPQGTQSDAAYAGSFTKSHVTNVFATTRQTSCYTPEVPYFTTLAPTDGYSGMTACAGGTATTGENLGPYPTQVGSNPGYPATAPMLVKDYSESDIRADPTNAQHLIGSSKSFVSAEGYNHLLGFYESFDGGKTWPLQGHIPGYEGWTDNTDPVGAFDGYGNYYEFILPYQFYYNSDGSHNFQINQNKEPNPVQPAEVVSIAVHPHTAVGLQTATNWITMHNRQPDVVAAYDSKGREPDKQWIAIDTNPNSPRFNRIYVMWTLFDSLSAVPFVSFADARADGTHTDWSTPVKLPTPGMNPQGDTYVLPHIDPAGVVYTTLTNAQPKQSFCCDTIILDESTDGGVTWTSVGTVASNIAAPAFVGGYANTTFTDGIENTFVVGPQKVSGHYPLYVAYEDHSAGRVNVLLIASYDGGVSWSAPIQVNDNANPTVDEFQPNLAVASSGTVSVAFYDRRLACPAAGTAEAVNAGLALDTANANYTGSLPPYGASNYCMNASDQFYDPTLNPIGHNIRLTAHTWDPQLNAPRRFAVGQANATFIGDYFGNIVGGSTAYTTFVSTYNDGTNPSNRQQQVIATLALP